MIGQGSLQPFTVSWITVSYRVVEGSDLAGQSEIGRCNDGS